MMDKYSCFRELREAEKEGVDYAVMERPGSSGVTLIAPHGGSIEPGTSEIADAIAGQEHRLYCFLGLKASGNRDLHITSTKFDEPRGIAAVRSAQGILAIHGCEGDEEIVYLGGLDDEMKQRIRHNLEEAKFAVSEPTDPTLGGTSKQNICNQNARAAGAQLELPTGLRSKFFADLTRLGRNETTEVFYKFVAGVRLALTDA